MSCVNKTGVEFWEKFKAATIFASECHSKQLRKGCEAPFISHPLAVASLVMESAGTNEAILAAILHDVIEDAGISATELENNFGARVAEIVLALTKRPINWKEVRKENIASVLCESRAIYAEHMRSADSEIQIVSAADKLHNARSILSDLIFARDDLGEGKQPREVASVIVNVWNRFIGRRELTIKYYMEMSEVYSESCSPHVRHLGRLLLGVVLQMQKDF